MAARRFTPARTCNRTRPSIARREGQRCTRLASGDVAHAFPVGPPNGRDFTYIAVRGDGRRVVRLRAGETDTDLGATGTHAELLDRWLLLVRDATLLADYRDDDGRMGGQDFPLALDVGATERGRGMFVASADVLLHAPAGEHRRQITWLDLPTGRAGTVGDVGDFWQIRVSPDDRSLAVTARDPLLGSLDVLNIPVDDQTAGLRLTTSIAADSDPVWSPDGRRIAVRSMQRGRPEVLVMPAALQAAADRPDSAPAAGTAGDVPTDWRAGELLVQRRGASGSISCACRRTAHPGRSPIPRSMKRMAAGHPMADGSPTCPTSQAGRKSTSTTTMATVNGYLRAAGPTRGGREIRAHCCSSANRCSCAPSWGREARGLARLAVLSTLLAFAISIWPTRGPTASSP